MGRFVGKLAVGGRLLDEAIGGTIHDGCPNLAASSSSGRVALSVASEDLIRATDGPIHLIADDGSTWRVDLGRSRSVGELYVAFDFIGIADDFGDRPIFSISAYSDLRGPSLALEAEDTPAAVATLLAFVPAEPGRRRRACSNGR